MEFGSEEFKQMASGLGHRARIFDYKNVITLFTKQDSITFYNSFGIKAQLNITKFR